MRLEKERETEVDQMEEDRKEIRRKEREKEGRS